MENLDIKKKEVLLSIIKKLYWHWDLAEEAYSIISNATPWEKIIDTVLDIMKNTIGEVKDKESKEKIDKSIKKLEKMQEIENEERLQEMQEVEGLFTNNF